EPFMNALPWIHTMTGSPDPPVVRGRRQLQAFSSAIISSGGNLSWGLEYADLGPLPVHQGVPEPSPIDHAWSPQQTWPMLLPNGHWLVAVEVSRVNAGILIRTKYQHRVAVPGGAGAAARPEPAAGSASSARGGRADRSWPWPLCAGQPPCATRAHSQ